MKTLKILLIENESEEQIARDAKFSGINSVEQAQDRLETLGFQLKHLEVQYDFHLLSRDEKVNLVLAENQIVCSYSMFTSTHYNSLGQILNLLAIARHAQNRVFIDLSGQLLNALNRNAAHLFKTGDQAINVAFGVGRNIITSYQNDQKQAVRIVPSFEEEMYKLSSPLIIV